MYCAPTGTFSLPMPDGNSWGSGSPERPGNKLYAPKVGQRAFEFVQASQRAAEARATNHIIARMTTLRGPHHDGFEIVVKDSHGDRGHSQQEISVS